MHILFTNVFFFYHKKLDKVKQGGSDEQVKYFCQLKKLQQNFFFSLVTGFGISISGLLVF